MTIIPHEPLTICISRRRWTFKSIDWVKQIALPEVDKAFSNQWLTRVELNSWIRGTAFCLTDYQSWNVGLPSNSNWNNSSCWVLSLPVFRLESIPPAFLVLRPLGSDWNYTLALMGIQHPDFRLWGFLSLYNHLSQSHCNKSFYTRVHTPTYPFGES